MQVECQTDVMQISSTNTLKNKRPKEHLKERLIPQKKQNQSMDSETKRKAQEAKRELGVEGEKTENPAKFLGEVALEEIGAVAETVKEKLSGDGEAAS